MFAGRILIGVLALLAWAHAMPAAAQNAAAGEALYQAYCVSCHGNPPAGGPDRAPGNPARIRAAISGVVPAMSILSFLTDPQLADIAAWVAQQLGPSPPTEPTANYTALWWNPAESGWGVNFNHQGNTIVFGTLFTYDATGAPLWLVMSNGVRQADRVTFSGELYRTVGPPFNANPFTPATATAVGTMTVSFSGENNATLTYSFNGTSVTKVIQRQVYGTRAATCASTTASRASATNYQDLWWNASESGWGVNITHQDNTLFATLFTYDATGRGLWLVMSAGQRQADGSYLGDLYRTTGAAFNASPFTGASATAVGTMRFRFTNGEQGTLTYTYNGVAVTKAITRQVFSTTVPLCQ